MTPVEAFIAELDTIPWFTNLGKPSPRDHEVFRIYHWGTWPGPEDPGFSLMSAFGMHWRDELFESAKSLPSLREAWHTIYEYVFYLTKPLVPYTEEWDLDHGPNIAE